MKELRWNFHSKMCEFWLWISDFANRRSRKHVDILKDMKAEYM